jgi:hypothetical protein
VSELGPWLERLSETVVPDQFPTAQPLNGILHSRLDSRLPAGPAAESIGATQQGREEWCVIRVARLRGTCARHDHRGLSCIHQPFRRQLSVGG